MELVPSVFVRVCVLRKRESEGERWREREVEREVERGGVGGMPLKMVRKKAAQSEE